MNDTQKIVESTIELYDKFIQSYISNRNEKRTAEELIGELEYSNSLKQTSTYFHIPIFKNDIVEWVKEELTSECWISKNNLEEEAFHFSGTGAKIQATYLDYLTNSEGLDEAIIKPINNAKGEFFDYSEIVNNLLDKSLVSLRNKFTDIKINSVIMLKKDKRISIYYHGVFR